MIPNPPPPLVLVTADVGQEADGYRWHEAEETYLRAVVVGAGAIPLILPSLGAAIDLDAVLDRVDGVLVTGAKSNVHPALYGEAEGPKSGPFDASRDATSLPLIRAAIARGVPLLAICRGLQELNVALGGSLVAEVQELPGRADHRAPVSDSNDVRFAIRQPVEPAAGGCVAGLVGPEPILVNSLHRQAIGRLAPGLAVEATAPDGTIEAVRVGHAPGFTLAVQWHPEYWVATDPASATIFRAFGDAIRDAMRVRLPALRPGAAA